MIGSTVSAVVANLISSNEQLALKFVSLQPTCRLERDTCTWIICVALSIQNALKSFITNHHINNICPSFQLTAELENEGDLPPLDTSIQQMENGSLDIHI